jgi:hypothetical protein
MEKPVEKSTLKLEIAVVPMIGYAHYASARPLFRRFYVRNTRDEAISEVEIKAESDFTLPFSIRGGVLPAKTTVNFDVAPELSPSFFATLDESASSEVKIEIRAGGKILASLALPVRLLGYNEYCGAAQEAELLAAFVPDLSPLAQKILKSAELTLKKWNIALDTSSGYKKLDNNEARYFGAAVFSAVQELAFDELPSKVISQPHLISDHREIMSAGKATPLEAALFYASAIRAAGLNPIVAVGEGFVLGGLWLVDKSLNDSVTTDAAELLRRMGEGVNEIVLFDVKNLFNGYATRFSSAEEAAVQALSDSRRLDFALDVKRARAGGVAPLPQRVKTRQGYRVIPPETYDTSHLPEAVKTFAGKDLRVAGSREKQWERRLLDLSLKNSLLNFKDAAAVRLLVSGLKKVSDALKEKRALAVAEAPQELGKLLSGIQKYETDLTRPPVSTLFEVELKNDRLRSFLDQKTLSAALTALYRKDRTFTEETGASSLYLALGFLKWFEKEDKKRPHYAPIILCPVTLKRDLPSRGFKLALREDDISVNTTLLEYLKQEFGLDIRGLAELAADDTDEILARIKSEVLAFEGWSITRDAYLASLTFSRYMLWHDLKNHIDEIKKNSVVKAILEGGGLSEGSLDSAVNPDSVYTSDKVYLPINADSSQFAAIVDCSKKSFVLHGPPGTGKSQTITNMIACSLARGRRVLFVAEKAAALSVVKSRLEEIGIADFCLELHSSKADKLDVAERLMATLKLADAAETPMFLKRAGELSALALNISETADAIHKQRKLGISVYEGAVKYLEYKNAPDLLEIDASFYEKLNGTLFESFESKLSELAAAAGEFGDVRKSPFKNANLTKYSAGIRARAEVFLKLYLEELAYVRKSADLCLSVFGAKVRTLSKKRLDDLYKLSRILFEAGNDITPVLTQPNTGEILSILASYKEIAAKYGQVAERYNAEFKGLPDNINYDMLQADLEFSGGKSDKYLNYVMRRLRREARKPLDKFKSDYYLRLLLLLQRYGRALSEKSQELSRALPALGGIDAPRVIKIIEAFDVMYRLAENVYTDFDRASFDSAVKEIAEHKTYDALKKFAAAYRSLGETEAAFVELFNFQGALNEIEDDYFEFMSKKLDAMSDALYLLPAWVKFNVLSRECADAGMSFAVKALSEGRLKGDDLIRCFKKNVYKNFVEGEIALDEKLAEFSSASLEELIERFKRLSDEFLELTKKEVYHKLIERLSDGDEEKVALEKLTLARAVKSRMKGITLRKLFSEIPKILKRAAPCMLMSPVSAAQYLDFDADKFDLVVFDEASQVPTAEAVGAIARGNITVIVGDENQLPPTSFFMSDYADPDNPEDEDLDSILDDAIAAGLAERRLLWHYRSKHESLIAFSNAMYYQNKLLTFPSPNDLESKVFFHYVEGVYDRGGNKTNEEEASALVEAVIAKLSDSASAQSIGIVTFNSAQQALIEDKLAAAIASAGLEARAYFGPEPLFVKNLENVQGDERDIIFFSVGYGPDKYSRLSLNFGPLNQQGGFRRLNVAITRAKSEMHLFSSITADMIDLSKTSSKGVFGLKAFLEFAEKGKTMLALDAAEIKSEEGAIGDFIAAELKKEGVRCRPSVGAGVFKIDVAVEDSLDPGRYVLAILCDSKEACEVKSVRDRFVSEVKILKQLGWNVYRMWTTNFLQNPKREIKKVKAHLEKLKAQSEGKAKAEPDARYKKEYKAYPVRPLAKAGPDYLLNAKNEAAAAQKIEAVINAEQPIAKPLLLKRLYAVYNITKANAKATASLLKILGDSFSGTLERFLSSEFLYYDVPTFDSYRMRNEETGKRAAEEIHPAEFVAAAKAVLEKNGAMNRAELIAETLKAMRFPPKAAKEGQGYAGMALDYGIKRGILIASLDNKITI